MTKRELVTTLFQATRKAIDFMITEVYLQSHSLTKARRRQELVHPEANVTAHGESPGDRARRDR
jgi:hypothetical protein